MSSPQPPTTPRKGRTVGEGTPDPPGRGSVFAKGLNPVEPSEPLEGVPEAFWGIPEPTGAATPPRNEVDDLFGWPEDGLDPFAELDLPLDPGIERVVRLLHASGVETFESCEGGPGHATPEPTVRFHGDQAAGWQALSVALNHGLPVLYLRRVWYVDGVEPSGPTWEMVFRSGQPAPAAAMTHQGSQRKDVR